MPLSNCRRCLPPTRPLLPRSFLHRLPQAVVTAIRGTGAKNMVAVGASRAWARYADSFVKYPIRDANWVAAVHLYLHPEELPPIAQGYCKVGGYCGRPWRRSGFGCAMRAPVCRVRLGVGLGLCLVSASPA